MSKTAHKENITFDLFQKAAEHTLRIERNRLDRLERDLPKMLVLSSARQREIRKMVQPALDMLLQAEKRQTADKEQNILTTRENEILQTLNDMLERGDRTFDIPEWQQAHIDRTNSVWSYTTFFNLVKKLIVKGVIYSWSTDIKAAGIPKRYGFVDHLDDKGLPNLLKQKQRALKLLAAKRAQEEE